MVTITVRLPAATAARLSAAAKAGRVSKSQIVREALENYFANDGHRRAITFYEAGRHMIGRVKDAHRDLTTNPKYLEGYGD
jgi:predicted transcriptional regulator